MVPIIENLLSPILVTHNEGKGKPQKKSESKPNPFYVFSGIIKYWRTIFIYTIQKQKTANSKCYSENFSSLHFFSSRNFSKFSTDILRARKSIPASSIP